MGEQGGFYEVGQEGAGVRREPKQGGLGEAGVGLEVVTEWAGVW